MPALTGWHGRRLRREDPCDKARRRPSQRR